jgi:type II secretory pathway pseudopilin PulG
MMLPVWIRRLQRQNANRARQQLRLADLTLIEAASRNRRLPFEHAAVRPPAAADDRKRPRAQPRASA